MKLAGRIAGAIEVLAEIFTRNRPASEALKDWGKTHRFAGSTDRHVIGTLVYDALRHRNTAAMRAGNDTARGLTLGTLAEIWQLPTSEIESLCTEQFGPGELTTQEKKALALQLPKDAPPHITGDFPQWLETDLRKTFGDNLVSEMAALSQRAPIDLRVNTLKASRIEVLQTFAKFAAKPTPFSSIGLRIPASGIEVRNVSVEAEPAHGLGQFEVQDEASQLAVLLTGVKPHDTVLDLCAGAGGKSLALAALMKNTSKLVAYDRDKHRLRPIFERITRSGASCIEVVPYDEPQKIRVLGGYDLVVVDAPCTGSGTWRRKPDAKWRLSKKQIEIRVKEQVALLEQAAALVGRGGKLAYFTCSVLPQENGEQVQAFLKRHGQFTIIPYPEQWTAAMASTPPQSADGRTDTLQLSPHTHGTDGFFVAIMRRMN